MIRAPQFCDMGPDLDVKGKSSTKMDIYLVDGEIVSKETEKMSCAKNCEDSSFLTEMMPNEHTSEQTEGAEVNVTDVMDSNEKGDSESESEDATEGSSSFGGSDSGDRDGPNDVEVESRLHEDGFGGLFRPRKKKLTAHWRKFIQPLMWRCKWVELQIRELNAQALKYDRQLSECEKRKQHDLLNITSEDLCVKSTPITCQNRKVNIMKRKKRKRVEEETDVKSYMSKHNLFSALVNKKPFADRAYMDDDFGISAKPSKPIVIGENFDVDGWWGCLEYKDDNTLEEILQKIDDSQLQLRMLKFRMDKVISDNAATIFSNYEVSTPCNALARSAPKPLPLENGPCPAGSSSHGEVTLPLLEMVESSNQTHIGDSCLKVKEELLIPDQYIKEEVVAKPIGKPKGNNALEVEEINAVHPAPDPETVSQGQKAASPAHQDVKIRPITKLGTPKKRKRARRKARINKYRRTAG